MGVGGVSTKFGGGRDEKLAARKRARLVNRACVVFEERAGDVLCEIIAIELVELIRVELMTILQAGEQFVLAQSGQAGSEALLDAGSLLCGQGSERFVQPLRFGGGEGHHLAAAGVAAFFAGDVFVVRFGGAGGEGGDGVGEVVQDREQNGARGGGGWNRNGGLKLGAFEGEAEVEGLRGGLWRHKRSVGEGNGCGK